MRFLIVAVLIICSYGYNLVDIYRYNGEKALVAKINFLLQDKNYWLSRLQNKDVRFGYYETPKNILVCIKEKKILNVYKTDENGFKKLDTINVLTGLDGQKEKEGDLRTPIGVYTLKDIIANINTYFGPFAFVTSYPNMLDKIENKQGYGIWIHGVPIDGKRDSNITKGCIVMHNNILKKLRNEINYQQTYLLITEHSPFEATKEEIAQILAFIYRWKYAWQHNDLKKYISYYAKDFKKADGENLQAFEDYKKRVFENKKYQTVKIYFKNISIIPYQNIKNEKLFRIDMFEEYLSNNYTYRGPKEIYVRLNNGTVKIIAEK